MGIDPLVTYALQHKLVSFPIAVGIVLLIVAIGWLVRRKARSPQSQRVDLHRARVVGDVQVRQEQRRRD